MRRKYFDDIENDIQEIGESDTITFGILLPDNYFDDDDKDEEDDNERSSSSSNYNKRKRK